MRQLFPCVSSPLQADPCRMHDRRSRKHNVESDNYRRPWTSGEDEVLRALVMKHGIQQWALIASEMIARNGKQCRERWHNQLDTCLVKDGALRGECCVMHRCIRMGKWQKRGRRFIGVG